MSDLGNSASDAQDFGPITQAIQAAGAGDSEAKEVLAEMVYEDLKRTANHLMRRDNRCTLQPTALVNEAYMQLVASPHIKNATSRAYFFGAAAKAMSRILVDAARKRNAAKRGGEMARVPLENVLAAYDDSNLDIISLDASLEELERLNPRQSQVVRMRFFLGFPVKEVASLLDISPSTVEDDWRKARAFLRSQLSDSDASEAANT